MAIITFYYLFDSVTFRQTMFPIVPELQRGNYEPLHELADYTLRRRPELWQRLAAWCQDAPAADAEDCPMLREDLTRACTPYLQPLFEKPFAWRFYRLGLSLVGWREEQIQLLLYGKTLRELFQGKRNVTQPERTSENWAWCEGHLGWLDPVTINELQRKLMETQPDYVALCRHPREVKEKMQDVERDMPLECVSQQLFEEFENVTNILATAQTANRAVAVAVA